MSLRFFKTFFVPLLVVMFVLSLTSCGKDYDLVSEIVVRDSSLQSQLKTKNPANSKKAALTDKAFLTYP